MNRLKYHQPNESKELNRNWICVCLQCSTRTDDCLRIWIVIRIGLQIKRIKKDRIHSRCFFFNSIWLNITFKEIGTKRIIVLTYSMEFECLWEYIIVRDLYKSPAWTVENHKIHKNITFWSHLIAFFPLRMFGLYSRQSFENPKLTYGFFGGTFGFNLNRK